VNVLDLFSGIGGFSLGLERAGMRTVAFCEIEPYCRAVLRKHWPNVPIYEDVRNLTADQLRADGIIPDVICGGFPCQDISDAGKRVGIEGARSGLWHEYARLIGEVAPAWVIIENVPALRARGLDTVLRQLASLGRDAEWHCVPASAAGARHRRDRIWIVSHAKGVTERPGLRTDEPTALGWGRSCNLHSAQHSWASEPDICRVADGVSLRVDRLKSLGNAVVPQIPEIIGRAIMQQHALRPRAAD
jgi:DNA (cytosine-5)-methyltransferase 1